jgi:hypothetical protein
MLLRAEPGKQRLRSRRTQELARSSAQENGQQKNGRLPIELRENRVTGQLREPRPSKDSSEVTLAFRGRN